MRIEIEVDDTYNPGVYEMKTILEFGDRKLIYTGCSFPNADAALSCANDFLAEHGVYSDG